MIKKAIVILLQLLVASLLTAGQIKNCPKCDSNYKSEYEYCPIDGEKLIAKSTETKEIDGFQNYKWGISSDEAEKIAKDQTFDINNSKPDITVLTANDFEFQGNDCLLKLEFYQDELYKSSAHFVSEANQTSVRGGPHRLDSFFYF